MSMQPPYVPGRGFADLASLAERPAYRSIEKTEGAGRRVTVAFAAAWDRTATTRPRDAIPTAACRPNLAGLSSVLVALLVPILKAHQAQA